MTISQGSKVAASDFNTIQTQMANVMGTGSGSTGWGQAVTSAQASGVIKASDWQGLYADINKAYKQITGAAVPTATCPQVVAGTKITANTSQLYANAVAAVNTSRLVIAPGNYTSSGTAYQVTRGAAWSTQIGAAFSVTWPSENAARFFFNSGGAINFGGGHPNASTPQDAAWNTMLTNAGSFSITAGTTYRASGSLGTVAAIGYYALTGANQLIYNGTHIGTGAYVNNDVAVYFAKITNGFQVTVYMTDEHTNSFYDNVAAGTFYSSNWAKSSAIVTGIVSPTYTTITNF